MKKKILLINSLASSQQPLEDLWHNLEQSDIEFSYLSENKKNTEKEKRGKAGKFYFGPRINNRQTAYIFLLGLLFLNIAAFVLLLLRRTKKGVDEIICCHFNEKLIFTIPAKILNIKVVWLELPNANYKKINKTLLSLFVRQSKKVKTIAFGNLTKTRLLSLQFPEGSMSVVYPGIKLAPPPVQDNIFNSLARADHSNLRRKFFAIGTVMDLSDTQRIETIFQAVKKCLEVVNDIQLVIVGDGEEKKNLGWLARKMGIENLVWFVSEQKGLRKWLESFDVFVVSAAVPKLYDFNNIIEAMAAGLPIIGPCDFGLEDLVYQNKTGALIEMDDSEILAQQLIKLYQDKGLRNKLGQMSRARAEEYFSLDKLVDRVREVL